MKQLYIVRGLPGSGKSTFARKISGTVWEADMFFGNDAVYQYVRSRISEAHEWCQAHVENSMVLEVPIIVVSNTFVRRWEMEPYYTLATIYGYEVTEVTMSGKLYKNIHGVPDETIERMRANWEK